MVFIVRELISVGAMFPVEPATAVDCGQTHHGPDCTGVGFIGSCPWCTTYEHSAHEQGLSLLKLQLEQALSQA